MPHRQTPKVGDRLRQWTIAKEALSEIFDGVLRTARTRGKLPRIQVGRGTWRLERMEACHKYLEKYTITDLTSRRLSFNEETAWIIVSRTLALQNLGSAALDVAFRYLDVCYGMQSQTNQRIPKSRVLAWLSERLRELGQTEMARGSMFLAFIEDLILNKNASESLAYPILTEMFDVSTETLETLAKRVETIVDLPPFPEEILVQWELDNVSDLSELWSRG